MISASHSDSKFFQANAKRRKGQKSYRKKNILSEGMIVLHHLEDQESGIIMALRYLDLVVQNANKPCV